MEVWIVEWTQPGQSESNVTVWDTEENARQSACADIMSALSDWNMNDVDTRQAADDINVFVGACNYKDAMIRYNEYQSDSNDYEYVDYYHVYPRTPLTTPQVPVLMCFDPPDEDEDIDEEIVEVVKSITCPCGMFRADCDYHK
jgi:hypothetical protein